MVPITQELNDALKARAWWGDARLRWAARASRNETIAHVSLYEFGELSLEKFRLWTNGRQILAGESAAKLLQALRESGIAFTPADIRLERDRGRLHRAVGGEKGDRKHHRGRMTAPRKIGSVPI